VKRFKILLIILTLLLMVNIQIYPLISTFSSEKIALEIKEIKYNFKKCIFSYVPKKSGELNVINTDNLKVLNSNYDNITVPYLVISGEIKDSKDETSLYINENEFKLKDDLQYWYLWWERNSENNSFKFTFYNNGLNDKLKPFIFINYNDPKKIEIKFKCKRTDESGNELSESDDVKINICYSPKIWIKLTVGNTKVEEIKPDKQVDIQDNKRKPIDKDWTPYQIYDPIKGLKTYDLETSPTIKNGRTLVPVRFIAEAFGAKVNYDGQNRKITIISVEKGFTIYLYVDKKDYFKWLHESNEPLKSGELDVPPSIENGRTLVPLRFIGEELGANVNWESNTKEIKIEYST